MKHIPPFVTTEDNIPPPEELKRSAYGVLVILAAVLISLFLLWAVGELAHFVAGMLNEVSPSRPLLIVP